ncbi:MAG: ChbG/HpnK family deacetylase [Lachnospiraceae bacterium]|jgi:predicted glycoside hydrolase/deacetylase ChbG (UPF0249 family)
MNRKIIIRADDVGYTLVNNIGAFETMADGGVVTAADVMLECPGTVDALERLRNLPWISVGWHAHFWGSPVLPFDRVPTLVDLETGHFRTDIRKASDINADELYSEMMAQMERCKKVLGRYVDTGGIYKDDGPLFDRIQKKVCDELGIVYNFVSKEMKGGGFFEAEPRYRDAGIFTLDGGVAYKDLYVDSIDAQEKNYDPYLYYAEDRGHMMEKYEQGFKVTTQSWHPGYVDYYMYQLGDPGPFRNKFTVIRTKDVEALTSERMRKWIIDNKLELVNFTDALYGRNDFQEHLKAIGSPLCMI